MKGVTIKIVHELLPDYLIAIMGSSWYVLDNGQLPFTKVLMASIKSIVCLYDII